jgi:hypothetical protein
MRTFVKSVFRRMGLEVSRYNPPVARGFDPLTYKDAFISLKTESRLKGNMLLSFITEPFMAAEGGHISKAHTNPIDSVRIAGIFLGLGYDVDVIHYRNSTFVPEKKYAFFVGARTNFERVARSLNEDCIKIAHLDTAHWVFNNYASYKRSLELRRRRGITVRESNRIIEQNMAIEYADYATLVGNQFTASTYEYAKKPVFIIPHSTCAVYPWPEEKNFESCRKNYVWFGSNGFVHKGLDLVLETFSGMPDYQLYVCGPIDREPDFRKAYQKELFETPNIHTLGWVDISSPQFVETMNKCVGTVYPSCAECGAGNALTCMQTGVIPVISLESGTDIDPGFGRLLENCSVDEIEHAVRDISGLAPRELEKMARKAWHFVRANHTAARFEEEYRKVIMHIMHANHNGNNQEHNHSLCGEKQ